MKPGFSSRRKIIRELLFLGALGVLAALFVVPVCWTANAKNLNFTGWCVSLAKLLEGGGKLYVNGSHMPLSPLPFLALHALAPTDKAWIHESAAHFACLVLTILIMHVVLSQMFRGPVPLLASLMGSTWFYTCANSLLYNSMPQVFVAMLCLLAFRLPATNAKTFLPGLLALCAAASLAILAKQSTGIGAAGGVCAWLLFAGVRPGNGLARTLLLRLITIGIFLAGTVMITWALIDLFSAYLDPAGFYHDVLLRGSETKGGSHYVVKLLVQAAQRVFLGLWFVLAFFLLLVGLGRRFSLWEFSHKDLPASAESEFFPAGLPLSVLFGAAAVALLAMALTIFYSLGGGRLVTSARHIVYVAACQFDTNTLGVKSGLIVTLGLAACLLLKLYQPGRNDPAETRHERGFLGVILIAFCSLLFHSLSDPGMGNYLGDQEFQPMLVVIAGVWISLSLAALESLSAARLNKLAHLFLVVALFGWLAGMVIPRYCAFLKIRAFCTLKAPEIHYLRGATLTENARGVIDLAMQVRQLVPAGDTVLLLPDDPNIQSWFDRPRPALSCPMIFSDQYWADYVETDFRALRAAPPRAIVIGPRNEMQTAHQWSPGAQELINRVKNELLKENYTLVYSQPFVHEVSEDFFDVYIRNNSVGNHE